ncbi:glycosyltransferase family A protein [Bradyrhizobium symbiodeficiens]|uniref:glycosyltransferase family 2 protein n=1 Tax=Bradyrhizobium symbiodeficiens TaxID=1404367 RepID=UPI0030D60C45
MTIPSIKSRLLNLLPEPVRNSSRLLTKRGRLVRKVKARKAARAASPHKYTDSPTVSLIIQSFNHRDNIETIVERLRLTTAQEVIVCEDGSVDGSEKAWRAQLTRPNDFVILSNDLHEIRTYNRAIKLAHGEFIGLLQDDDIPPTDPSWVDDVVKLFRKYPKMAILSGWNGWTFDLTDIDKSIGAPVGPAELFRDGRLDMMDPESKIPFQFVEAVGIGPMFFRRTDFQALGGFDEQLSRPGEPGIWLDYDISLRAWLSDRWVGVYQLKPFERNVGGQGTVMFGNAVRSANFTRNLERFKQNYSDHLPSVRAKVEGLNEQLVPRSSQ